MRVLIPLLLLALATVALAAPATDATWPRVTILPMPTPVIDGRLAPGEWSGAVAVTGFTRLRQQDVLSVQPVVRIAWTPQALLIGAEIPSPPGQKAHARATDFDGTVWEDDSLEVHLDRGHAHKQNYQFVVNALGTKFDSRGGDKAFNATWEAGAGNEPGKWQAEFAIPWSAVGGAPKAGDMDGFNFIINSSYLGGTLTYAPLKGSAHDAPSYAHLIYGKDLALSLERLDVARQNQAVVQALGAGEATLQYQLGQAGQAAPVSRGTVRISAGATGVVPIEIPVEQGLPRPGDYTFSLTATGPQGLLLTRQVEIKVDLPVRMKLSAILTRGTLDLSLQTSQSVFPSPASEFDISVQGAAGQITRLEHYRLPAPPTNGPVLSLRREQLPAGPITFKVSALNKNTGQHYSVERTVQNPLRPEWLGTKEGLTEEVPAPWTAVTVKNGLVNCWGRTYGFKQGLLPGEVTTKQASVLARPVTLTGTADGAALNWSSGMPTVAEQKPVQVQLNGSQSSGAVKLTGTTLVEYDGMIRCDLSLAPTAGKTTIQELTLEIPLKPQYARYLYHFPGRWGSVANSGFLPQDGWRNPFKPYVWLGDEDRGFSWFCESDRNWFPLDNKTALTIERTPQATVLKCHLIAEPTTVEQPLTYTFGFQATPVKQPDLTVWDARITHHGTYGLEKQQALTGGRITYPAAGHLRKEQGTFECWYRPAVDSENNLPFEQRTYQGNRSIFTVQWSPGGAGTNAGLYWNGTSQGLVAWSRTDGVVTDNPHTTFPWKGGEWHHIALTWDSKVRIYLDGKVLIEMTNRNFFGAPFEDATIIIGDETALATIDEVRILSVSRPPVVTDQPFARDAQTLLLDHFDNYGKGATDKPAGTADAWVRFGPGKFGLAPTWAPGQGKLQLDELYDSGVRTICFHEHWVPYQSYPHVTDADRPKLRALADAMKAKQLNLLLYMSRQFADNCPEWELHNAEFCQEPRPGPYTRMPPQRAYIGCWNSPFRDFALHYLAQTMDEFGNAGWYLDGPEWPMPCANELHGCGYVAPNGTRRAVWDIFATREFMKRLYVLTRQRNPRGQLNIHNSTVMVTPTLAWGTTTWGGEQIDAIKPPVKTLDILPMDAFRTEFMGRQWGIPSEFLVYDGMPYYAKDVLAYTLLHGVPIRPFTPEAIGRMAALWKVHDEFPFSHGTMLGYWNNAEYVTVQPQGVYATIWTLPQKGALVVVSNLNDADAQAKLSLQLAKLGCKGTITDAISGETLTHAKGTLTVPVESWRYRVLRVR